MKLPSTPKRYEALRRCPIPVIAELRRSQDRPRCDNPCHRLPSPINEVYNVAVGDRTTLNELYDQLHRNLVPHYPHLQGMKPVYRDFRVGDVRHSLANISKVATRLGYAPTQRIGQGLALAMPWYIGQK